MNKIIYLLLIAIAILTTSAAGGTYIVAEEETPTNPSGTRFLVQYIVEGDIIMIDECECSPANQCGDKYSIQLIKYKCDGDYNSVCCVRPIMTQQMR